MTDPLTTALQTGLAIEDQIIYGYGVVGAHLPLVEQSTVMSAWDAHRERRDQLAALITAMSVTPVEPQPAYALPFAVTNATRARRLAARLETSGGDAASAIIDASGPATAARHLGVDWLTASAIDEFAIGRRLPSAFPGMPDPAGG